MADKIKLPPLPEPVYTYDEDGNKVFYEKASLVRARDLEVAKCVLEAAAKCIEELPCECCWPESSESVATDFSFAIRTLEFTHAE